MLKLYQLRRSDDRLDGWWIIYDTIEENFVTWAFIEKTHVELPEYMKQYATQDNDFPVILKRRPDAEHIVNSLTVHRRPAVQQSQTTFIMPAEFEVEETAA